MSVKITVEHVRAAINWALTHRDIAGKIGGIVRRYKQSVLDDGESCNIWGAASILAGNGPATEYPSHNALGLGAIDDVAYYEIIAVRLILSHSATPEHILAALDHLCDENGNWKCKYCIQCEDCESCEHCQDCERCIGCESCEFCSDCENCTDCLSCVRCARCVLCRDCEDSVGCSDLEDQIMTIEKGNSSQ